MFFQTFCLALDSFYPWARSLYFITPSQLFPSPTTSLPEFTNSKVSDHETDEPPDLVSIPHPMIKLKNISGANIGFRGSCGSGAGVMGAELFEPVIFQ